ncbi:MAG: tRNA pseudouridine(13) synthase TruD [Candidatus Micrarchaeia archaeon]
MYLSNTEGIGGIIKNKAENFIVEEITQNGNLLEIDRKYKNDELNYESSKNGKFAIFILQKKNWNTIQALKVIARKFKRGIKSMGFAGTKDRTSISTQLCSFYGIKEEQLPSLESIKIRDISINGAWLGDKKIELGDLQGNRFTITIEPSENIDSNNENRDFSTIKNKIESINKELNGVFPNYFGSQRFGSRSNNVKIGIDILKGDFEDAAITFLTDTTNEHNEEAIDARKKLKAEMDFKQALQYFPKYLKYERLVLEHLSNISNDYAGALRRLPRNILLMFTHSVSSYIFNTELDYRIEHKMFEPLEDDLICYENELGFPDMNHIIKYKEIEEQSNKDKDKDKFFIVGNIVGYEMELNSVEKRIMDELKIDKEDFKVKSMPELKNKGSSRLLFAPYLNFNYNVENNKTTMRFSLLSGSYATVLLDEFMKNKNNK